MSEMVKRVARAIEDQMASDANHPDNLARAAMAAIKEPTEAMVEAGAVAWSWDEGSFWVWRAMIDEALR